MHYVNQQDGVEFPRGEGEVGTVAAGKGHTAAAGQRIGSDNPHVRPSLENQLGKGAVAAANVKGPRSMG